MYITTALLALLTSLTVVSSQNSSCHDYVIISIRGTYEAQGPSIGFLDMINTTLSTLPNGIEYDAVYPAAPEQTAYLGADDVVRFLTENLQTCPNQKYAILGYSQGASATGLALMNYTDPQSAGYQAIKAVLVIGNPYHKPNESVNVDQNGTDATRSYPGALYNASATTTQGIPEAWYNSGKLLDICYYGDVVCAPGSPNSSFTLHLQYGLNKNVQKMGSDFLISKLSGNGTSSSGVNGTGSTGSTTTTTTMSAGSSSTSAGSTGATSSSSSSSSRPASSTSGTASATPSTPGAATGLLPGSFLALVVCVAAVLATSGI